MIEVSHQWSHWGGKLRFQCAAVIDTIYFHHHDSSFIELAEGDASEKRPTEHEPKTKLMHTMMIVLYRPIICTIR
jgi:hypothetical protein